MECRLITAYREFDSDVRSQAAIVGLCQSFANLGRSNPDDGRSLGVEVVASPEHVDGNIGFLDNPAAARQGFLDHVTEEILPPAAPRERRALQHIFQMCNNLQSFFLTDRDGGMKR